MAKKTLSVKARKKREMMHEILLVAGIIVLIAVITIVSAVVNSRDKVQDPGTVIESIDVDENGDLLVNVVKTDEAGNPVDAETAEDEQTESGTETEDVSEDTGESDEVDRPEDSSEVFESAAEERDAVSEDNN